MSRRLALALSLSALLIGGATVYRFAYAQKVPADLTVVQGLNGATSDTTIVDAPVDSGVAAAGASLTTTDLVGRQMIADYLDLTQNGQATDDNVTALVNNYADKLSTLDTFTPLTQAEITLSTDSKTDLQAYATTVMALHDKYKAETASIAGNADLSSVDSKSFASTMSALGKVYEQAAGELTKTKVPPSLSAEHLKLINLYLSDAKALSAVGSAQSDAASAYAALNVQAQNTSELSDIITSMQTKLLGSAIVFNISI